MGCITGTGTGTGRCLAFFGLRGDGWRCGVCLKSAAGESLRSGVRTTACLVFNGTGSSNAGPSIQPSFDEDDAGEGSSTVIPTTSSAGGSTMRVGLGGDELLRLRVRARNNSRVRRVFELTVAAFATESSPPIQPSESSSSAGLSPSSPYSETDKRGFDKPDNSSCGSAG